MRKVRARGANHDFSKLLRVWNAGEEILITKRSKPVALLSPYYRRRGSHRNGKQPLIMRLDAGRGSMTENHPVEFVCPDCGRATRSCA